MELNYYGFWDKATEIEKVHQIIYRLNVDKSKMNDICMFGCYGDPLDNCIYMYLIKSGCNLYRIETELDLYNLLSVLGDTMNLIFFRLLEPDKFIKLYC